MAYQYYFHYYCIHSVVYKNFNISNYIHLNIYIYIYIVLLNSNLY